MYRWILFSIIILLWLQGCSIKEVMPPVKTYALQMHTKVKIFKHSRCSDDILKVRALRQNSIAISQNIYYGIGKYYVNSYTQSQWLQSPSYRVNSFLINTFERSHIFKAVIANETEVSSNLLLEYSIENFTQYFNHAKTKSYVDAKIRFLLINSNNNKLIALKIFDKKLPAPSENALGEVKALGGAVSDIAAKATIWLDNICQKER